jgi:hypothetical protein
MPSLPHMPVPEIIGPSSENHEKVPISVKIVSLFFSIYREKSNGYLQFHTVLTGGSLLFPMVPIIPHGPYYSLWTLLFPMVPIIPYGPYYSLWTLLFPMVPIIPYGPYYSLWSLLFPMVPIIPYGPYYSLWSLLFPMDPIIPSGNYYSLGQLLFPALAWRHALSVICAENIP